MDSCPIFGVHYSTEVFSKEATTSDEAFEKERTELYSKIGDLEMQRDWLKKVETIGHPVSDSGEP